MVQLFNSPLFLFLSLCSAPLCFLFFFFNDTATTEIYTLSLHDALPISAERALSRLPESVATAVVEFMLGSLVENPHLVGNSRSEEHTSELQSHLNLVCRLLLEKKKNMVDINVAAEIVLQLISIHNRRHL